MKNLKIALLVCLTAACLRVSPLQADTLQLNGLATYELLRRQVYIGALYLPTPQQDADVLLNDAGTPKRMELRVLVDRWSPRSFSDTWNQAISINSTPDELHKLSTEILSFTSLLPGSLEYGDQLRIDYQPDQGTTVSVNGHKMQFVPGPHFFPLLLRTWVGQRPPSTEFRQAVLKKPADSSLELNFEALSPAKERVAEVRAWESPVAAAEAQQLALAEEAARKEKEEAEKLAKAEEERTLREAALASVAAKPAGDADKEKLLQELKAKEEQARLADEKRVREQQAAALKARLAAEQLAARRAEAAKREETAQASSEDDGLQSSRADYHAGIIRKIYGNISYPKRAIQLQQEGDVLLSVRINRNGQLVSVKAERETEHSLLNRAALQAVEKVAAFDPFPDGIRGEQQEFRIPVKFRMPR